MKYYEVRLKGGKTTEVPFEDKRKEQLYIFPNSEREVSEEKIKSLIETLNKFTV